MTRIIFMGTPDYAAEILHSLINADDVDVVAVYTQPDKPVGRKAVLTAPSVKVLAEQFSLPVFQPNRLRDEDVVREVLSIPCDLIIVAAYGQILPKEILDYVPCINLHASILPHYRGASPIQQSLLNDDNQSGVTAMWMDVGLDTGPIIEISTLEIAPDEMVESLYKRLTAAACALTLDVICTWDRRSAAPQEEAKATHCKKISKTDGLIAFVDAAEIHNRYRAFTPWPGIFTESGLKIKSLSLEEKESLGNAGEIISIDANSIVVACTRGSLRIAMLQAPSKQETSAVSYLNGKRWACGNILA
ncbi:MAG: methionyl-tRNA formyltransferase [Sulfuricurvum sp.]